MVDRDDLAAMFAGQQSGYEGDVEKYLAQRRLRGVSDTLFGLPDLVNTVLNAGIRDVGHFAGYKPDEVYQLPMASQAAADLATNLTGADIVGHGEVTPEVRQSGANQQALWGMVPTGGVEDLTSAAAKTAMIIGPKAAKFPSLFLKAAEEDLAAGKPVEEVWQQWGIEPDVAGNPVSEISDRAATMNEDAGFYDRNKNFFPKREPRLPMTDRWASRSQNDPSLFWGERSLPLEEPMNLGTLFKHDELFENYPDLKKVPYQARATLPGQYSGAFHRAGEYDDTDPNDLGMIEAAGTDPAVIRSPNDVVGVTLHEAQHAIQNAEDMPRGGSPRELGMYPRGQKMQKLARREYLAALKAGDDVDTPRMQYLGRLMQAHDDQLSHFAYESQAGETQARNVAGRRDMPPEERARVPPSATEDVPRDYQLITPQSKDLIGALEPAPGRDELARIGQESAPLIHPSGAPLRPTPEGAKFRLPSGLPKAKVEQAKVFPETTLRSPEPEPTIQGAGLSLYKPRFFENVRLPDRPQFALPRFEGATPSARVQDLLKNPTVQQGVWDAIQRGKEMGGPDWYVTDPLLKRYIDIFGPDLGHQMHARDMMMNAATSPQQKVHQNIPVASEYSRVATENPERPIQRGDPITPGYGHYVQKLHQDYGGDVMDPGFINSVTQPKPPSYGNNLVGNYRPVAVDIHATRLPAMLSGDERWLTKGSAENPAGREAFLGGVPMADLQKQPTMWDDTPNEFTEYPFLEKFYQQMAADAGLNPAGGQASGWLGGGADTGLGTSTALPWLGMYEDQVERTAKWLNMDPKDVIEQVIRGQRAFETETGYKARTGKKPPQ